MTHPHALGDRRLSTFRSWDFEATVLVLFDDSDFRVWKAARLPVKAIESAAHPDQHVAGYRVYATDELLAIGEDWTGRLQAVESRL